MSAPLAQSDTTAKSVPAPPPGAGRPLHPRHANLDSLIRAGVVTHLVAVDESLDPVFTVGQMRDLAEVSFAAAFRDGLIAIGCPMGLPDELTGVAIRAVPVSPPPERAANAETSDTMRRIDRLSAQVENLLAEVRPATGATAALADRLDRLEEASSARSLRKVMAPLVDQLGALHHRLDLAEEAAAASPDADLSARLDDRFARLEERLQAAASPEGMAPILEAIASLSVRLQTPAEPDHRLYQELIVLRKKLDGITEAPPDSNAQDLKFDKFATVLSMIVKRTEAAAAQVRDAVEQMRNGSAAGADLQAVAERLDRIAPPDLGPVTTQIDALREEVRQLSTRPAATTDNGEDRQRLATLDATMERLASRIDAALGPAAEHDRRQEDILIALADLRTDLATRADIAPGLAALEQGIALLSTEGATLPAQIEKLREDVANWADRPQPEPDLSGIEDALTRLAARPAPVIDLTPLESGIATLVERADTAPLPQDHQAELAQITRQIAALANHPATQEATLQALREDVAALLARPDALGELVAQKQGFARLSSSLGAAVARLDTLASRIRSEDSDLLEEVRALPDILCNAIERTANLGPLHTALESLRHGLAQLPHRSDLEPLHLTLSTLAERADPDAALAAQRQSLARMGTGITMLIDRLEQVVRDPGVTETITAEGQRLAATLTQMERRLSVMAQDHADHLDALVRRVDRTSHLRGDSTARHGPFDRVRAEFSEFAGSGTLSEENDSPAQAAE